MSIEVLPLGAGQDVGRSCCIVRMAGRTVMFDCGAHFGFRDERRFPEFGLLSRAGRFTEIIDALVITHFHTDHLGALPYFTEICGYRGPILMTYPTFAIAPIMLEDYVKVNADRPGDRLPYNEQHVRDCLRRVTAVDLHQVASVAPGLSFTFHYAGHVLGAAMVHMTAGHLTALYTGDFNSSADRHLGSAEPPTPPGGPSGAPLRRPDVLISEATYAASLRDSKRGRERDLLQAVVETVTAGGKVLIPTFAMGRAQELLMLITDCWERNGLQVPIYFSSAMASRALVYYQLLLNWTNDNVRRTIFFGGAAATPTAATALTRDDGGVGGLTRYYRPYHEPGGGGDGGGGEERTAGMPGASPRDAADDDDGSSGDDGGLGLHCASNEDDDPTDDDVGQRDAEYDSGFEAEQQRPQEERRRRRRRRPLLLPTDVAGGDARGHATAGGAAGAAGGGSPGGGDGGGGFTKSVGVFSEADVYGMFRTRPWDRSLLHAPGPALLFASPGNITSGVSLEAFRAWAGSPRNLLVLAGYQVRGTLGARLEAIQNRGLQQPNHKAAAATATAAAATVDVPGGGSGGPGGPGGGGPGGGGSRVEVRCRIKMLAFSAHADLRGLLGLVRRCAPRAVVLVHGQREPMEFLRGRIEGTLGIECHAPPTGTTVAIAPRRAVPLGVRPQLVTAAGCAAGQLAAQAATAAAASRAAAAAAAEGPRGGTGRGRIGTVDGTGSGAGDGLYGFLTRAALQRLPPQPLTALPLSGVVVARVVPASHQLPPGPPLPLPLPPQPPGDGHGSGGAGAAATQLTLTDSVTASRAVLQAHQVSHGTAVKPYKLTYGCTIVVRMPAHATAGGGAGMGWATVATAAGPPPATEPAGASRAEAVAAAALTRAHVALCAAVGGYAATRKLRLDAGTRSLSFGSFRAQLHFERSGDALVAASAVTASDLGLREQEAGGGIAAAATDDLTATQGGAGVGEGGGGEGRAPPVSLRIGCEWSAAEDAAACRCLQALRTAFGAAGS